MEPLLASSSDGPSLPRSPPSVGGSILTLLAFLALAAFALFVVSYPLAAVASAIAVVVVAAVVRSFARLVRRHRGSLRQIDIPGIGTIEYRVLRS